MTGKPRLTVRPSRHGFIASAKRSVPQGGNALRRFRGASRGGERWFVIAQEAPSCAGARGRATRAQAEALALQLAAEAMGKDAAR